MNTAFRREQHGIDSAQRCMIRKDMQVKHARRTASVFCFGILYIVQIFLYISLSSNSTFRLFYFVGITPSRPQSQTL